LYAFCIVAFASGASSDDYVNNVMVYIKWIDGVISGFATLSAVGLFVWGKHQQTLGDPKGGDMMKNALWTVIIAAVGWAVLGALLLRGAELNTSITNAGKGWQ